ncbi:MAG: hypothetical protein NTU88_05350, partial [Armatimonadetes bacterium]|nr:hypothetical protein [Armatimonadota bacterium]
MAAIAVITALALSDRIALAAVMALALVALASVAAYRQPEQSWRSEMKAYEYPLEGRTLSALSPAALRPEWTSIQKEASAEAAKHMASGPKTLLEIETPYHHLAVPHEGPVRKLVFGKADFRGARNEMDLRNLSWHIAEYTQLAFSGLLYGPPPKRGCG